MTMIGLKTQIIDEEGKQILKKSLGMFIGKLHEKHHNNIIDDDSVPHSIITAYLETDKHTIESIYDEDNIGSNSLEISAKLLRNSLGLSGIILRLIISLEHKLKNDS